MEFVRTEVDGVPAFWAEAETEGELQAGVGLPGRPGDPDEVAHFFAAVCRALPDLPMGRLATERGILRTESSGRPRGVTEPLLPWRYGSATYGLLAYAEFGPDDLTPGDREPGWRAGSLGERRAVGDGRATAAAAAAGPARRAPDGGSDAQQRPAPHAGVLHRRGGRGRLRRGRPAVAEDDLETVRSMARDALRRPGAAAAFVPNAAVNLLMGAPVLTPRQVCDQLEAVSVEDVRAVADEALASGLLMIPVGQSVGRAGSCPPRSGRRLRSRAGPSGRPGTPEATASRKVAGPGQCQSHGEISRCDGVVQG